MKKFSNKYLNNYNILSKAIIGFEFECFFNISFYKVLEQLNKELAPVRVHGFRTYHSDFVPDDMNFKLERDLSGGQDMAEIVTGPMDYNTAKIYLIKILRFIDKYAKTSDKSGIHINISFKDLDVKNISMIKQIFSIDEEAIYEMFPSRKNNVYAKSIKKLIPYKQFDYSDISLSAVNSRIEIPDSKYYGINFKHLLADDNRRIEIRYIGGKNYHNQVGDIMEIMDNVIIITYKNIEDTSLDSDTSSKIYKYIDKKVNLFKSLNEYDKFLVEYPNIEIQIDQDNRYEIVSSHYGKIYDKIYNFLTSIEGINEGVFNFHTETSKLEIVGAEFKCNAELHNYDFIRCDIYNGIFTNSNIYDTKISNVEISTSRLDNSTINESKVISCNVNLSDMKNCYFQAGILNGYMEGGIFRSGQIGENAQLSESTFVVGKDKQSFFNTTSEEDDKDDKDDKKGEIKK